MIELLANAASSTLAASALSTDTSLTVTSSAGFPTPVAGVSQFRAVLTNASTGAVIEYVTVTAVSGTTWTVTRASEDAAQFPAAALPAGTVISQVVTADSLPRLAGALTKYRVEVARVNLTSGSANDAQSVSTAFTTINFQANATTNYSQTLVDPSSLWDGTNNYYPVPFDGLYFCQATLRVADNTLNPMLGTGVNTANADIPQFLWQSGGTASTGTTRYTAQYTRIGSFKAGDLLRYYAYCNSSISTNGASLVIIPLSRESA